MFDELECIGNLKRGSYKAFTQIYDEYADSIFCFALRHRIIDTLRRQMREPKFEEYIEHCAEDPTDVSPEDIIMYEEFLSLVTMAKEKLTPRERQIYELSRDFLLSNSQIAEKLGISEQTVKNHLSAALHILREALGGSPLIFIFWL